VTYPRLEESFGHWFAGFVDGEGCFRIKPTNMGTFQCRFSIGLRADDAPILHEIRARTGVGILVHSGRNSIQQEQWRLEVNRKADGVRLVEIFDDFPLRAKKARDFAIWREAVSVWSSVVNGRRADWSAMAALADALREERRFRAVEFAVARA
jgi:hypothetical protein